VKHAGTHSEGTGVKVNVSSGTSTSAALKILRTHWPDEFKDGVDCGLLNEFPGVHEPGGYPNGFHSWPLERRNAWIAGFNVGYTKRRASDGAR
jgi:hypothetical protein